MRDEIYKGMVNTMRREKAQKTSKKLINTPSMANIYWKGKHYKQVYKPGARGGGGGTIQNSSQNNTKSIKTILLAQSHNNYFLNFIFHNS